MPFIPHTEKDTREMLAAIGAESIEDLFDEIPAELRIDHLHGVPEALSEMEISRLMRERAAMDGSPLCFIGAGAYEHHIPRLSGISRRVASITAPTRRTRRRRARARCRRSTNTKR